MVPHDDASRLTENVLVPEIDQVSEALTMCRVGHKRDLKTVLTFWSIVRPVLSANGLRFVDDDYASILAIVRLNADRIGGELGKRFADTSQQRTASSMPSHRKDSSRCRRLRASKIAYWLRSGAVLMLSRAEEIQRRRYPAPHPGAAVSHGG